MGAPGDSDVFIPVGYHEWVLDRFIGFFLADYLYLVWPGHWVDDHVGDGQYVFGASFWCVDCLECIGANGEADCDSQPGWSWWGISGFDVGNWKLAGAFDFWGVFDHDVDVDFVLDLFIESELGERVSV